MLTYYVLSCASSLIFALSWKKVQFVQSTHSGNRMPQINTGYSLSTQNQFQHKLAAEIGQHQGKKASQCPAYSGTSTPTKLDSPPQ